MHGMPAELSTPRIMVIRYSRQSYKQQHAALWLQIEDPRRNACICISKMSPSERGLIGLHLPSWQDNDLPIVAWMLMPFQDQCHDG